MEASDDGPEASDDGPLFGALDDLLLLLDLLLFGDLLLLSLKRRVSS